MRTILATIKDYGDDFQDHMDAAYFEKLLDAILLRLLVEYVQLMLDRKLKLSSEADTEAFAERISVGSYAL